MRTFRNVLSVSIAWLYLSPVTFAAEQPQEVPAFIVQDLVHEIQEADHTGLTGSQKNELIEKISRPHLTLEKLELSLNDSLKPDFHFTTDYFISAIKIKPNMTSVEAPDLDAHQKHAISNIRNYVKNRLGPGTYSFLSKNSQHEALIVAGDPDQAFSYLTNSYRISDIRLIKIPSLYEKWGITKIFARGKVSGKEKSIVIWVVPPSLHYLRHYVTLFSTLENVKVKGFYDFDYEKKFAQKMEENSRVFWNRNKNVEFISFGYERNWLKEIQTSESIKTVSSEIVSLPHFGVKINVLEFQDTITKKKTQLGLLKFDETVWGQLAADHIKAFLNADLKGVFFLGSAGSINYKIDPYSVSVPKEFINVSGKVKIQNLIQPIEDLSSSTKIHAFSRHGNTFSPIQQDKDYVVRMMNRGVDTVDVEQSLVASAIEKFNSVNKTRIQFGAVNVVTDKPVMILDLHHSDHDLDKVNMTAKDKARQTAASLALKTIFNETQFFRCSGLF